MEHELIIDKLICDISLLLFQVTHTDITHQSIKLKQKMMYGTSTIEIQHVLPSIKRQNEERKEQHKQTTKRGCPL
jgi:hypothetical protein